MPPLVLADQWGVKARLPPFLQGLSIAAVVAFMVSWVIGVAVTPSPKWTWTAGSAAFAVGFASALMYQLVNHLVSDPIEPPPHSELETPTSESGTNHSLRSALFPLLVVAALVWLAIQTLH
jgi:hypothetical protein